MSAARAGDWACESDPLHLLAAAERDDTPLLHPFPAIVSDSHKDLLPYWAARVKAALWLLWSSDWNRLGFI